MGYDLEGLIDPRAVEALRLLEWHISVVPLYDGSRIVELRKIFPPRARAEKDARMGAEAPKGET